MSIRQAVILCGGRGERLGEIARSVPKPLLPLHGRPVLDHIMDNLEEAGVRRMVLAAGHLGRRIDEYYRSSGRRSSCSIETVVETEPLGTAGALRSIADRLDEDFLLVYGDVFIDIAVDRLIAEHQAHRPLGTLLVRASDHPWDSDLVDADESGHVRGFVHHREPGRLYRNVANAAVYALSRGVVDFIPSDRPSDFGAEVFPSAIAAGATFRVCMLEANGFVKDMGTPDRLAAVEEYLTERALATAARNASRPVRTVFLDRDGVLNTNFDLVRRPDQLEMLPGAAEAVSLLCDSEMSCVVVTNQPVIARGLCTETVLDAIHHRLREMIRAGGGDLTAIYHCPHHPETHHGEGVASLRRACRCRKPAPGLLFRAARELDLDLASCVMVGNHATDIQAGQAAGVRTVLLGPPKARAAHAEAGHPDAEFNSLLAFAEALRGNEVFAR